MSLPAYSAIPYVRYSMPGVPCKPNACERTGFRSESLGVRITGGREEGKDHGREGGSMPSAQCLSSCAPTTVPGMYVVESPHTLHQKTRRDENETRRDETNHFQARATNTRTQLVLTPVCSGRRTGPMIRRGAAVSFAQRECERELLLLAETSPRTRRTRMCSCGEWVHSI